MRNPDLIPLTRARLERFTGAVVKQGGLKGYSVWLDGECVAVIGLVREWWWLRMFADIRPEVERRRGMVTVLRAARELLAQADRTVYARADPEVPRAADTLLWLGFEPLPLGFFRHRRR